jgi:hypothetical protein
MNFIKVFDLVESGYRTWSFATNGLIFIVIGSVLVLAPYISKKYKISYIGFEKRSYKVFSWFMLIFALFWTTTSFLGTFSNYKRLKSTLTNGRYKIVEGPVENFDPMPYSGHKEESFTVNGIKFSFSDYIVTNAFNNTKSHGGPIDENSYVKIYYTVGGKNNSILKLWIRDYKGPIKNYSNGIKSVFKGSGGKGKDYPFDAPEKAIDGLKWYSNLFIFVIILDYIGIILFVIPYWKTFIPLRKKTNLSISIPDNFHKDIKSVFKNITYKWDTIEGIIWARPKGLNVLHIPFTIVKWTLDGQQKKIVKEEIEFSFGVIIALILMYFSTVSLFKANTKFPFDIDYFLIGFFVLAIILNGWIFTRRMKDLCAKTVGY